MIGRWLERRRALGFNGRHRLVCVISNGRGGPTTPGGRVDVSYVGRMLKRLAERAGLEGVRVHPHALRHSHAAELAAEGVPVNEIQAQLGHINLSTTDRYLRHIAPALRVERMRARQWALDD